jgi:Family of unknown function (DUF6069)
VERTTENAATHSADTSQPSWVRLAEGTATGVAIALVINLAIYLMGNRGAALRVVTQGAVVPSKLGIVNVVGASIVPVSVASIGAWILRRKFANGLAIWTRLVIVLTMFSLLGPLVLEVQTDSKISLLAMHLATTASALTGQRVSRRSV